MFNRLSLPSPLQANLVIYGFLNTLRQIRLKKKVCSVPNEEEDPPRQERLQKLEKALVFLPTPPSPSLWASSCFVRDQREREREIRGEKKNKQRPFTTSLLSSCIIMASGATCCWCVSLQDEDDERDVVVIHHSDVTTWGQLEVFFFFFAKAQINFHSCLLVRIMTSYVVLSTVQ